MKIIFFETDKKEENILKKMLADIPEMEAIFHEERLNQSNVSLAKSADIVSVFVDSEMRKEVLDILPDLKFIVTRSTGYDHIDISYAREKGIKVASIPGYGAHTVAEFTFALILMLSRNTYTAYHQLREGSNFDISNLQGFDLFGKTLGVIGMGRIGKNVIKIAKGFGMETIACDPNPDMKFAEETGTKCASMDELLATADILTLHTVLNDNTRHLINKESISKMKKGAYLINTSRGEVVDTGALLEAITNGHLAGAGLDVLEAERQLKEETKNREGRVKDFKTLYEDHILIDLPQVIVTPHIAFDTKEAEEEILKITVENISGFLKGENKNIVK